MEWKEREGVFQADCREFVTLARRGISQSVPTEEDEPHMRAAVDRRFPPERRVRTELSFEADGHRFLVVCHADRAEEDTLYMLCPTEYAPAHPPKTFVAEARGEGYVTAYAYLKEKSLPAVYVHFLYLRTETGEEKEVTERLTEKKLAAFFEKCRATFARYAAPAAERARVRLPSMRSAVFPYPHVRAGQDELMAAVYRTVKRGTSLCAEAPTGIGKTVSVLYPAVRAMGDGACEKIFYLTPKGTTADAAESALADMAGRGVRIRAVRITAKEKICDRHTVCRESRGACDRQKTNRLADAALSLWQSEDVTVGREGLLRAAATYGVCPYELSLSYAELCDVVICDFNYLFDPAVYIKRFFDDDGRYAFLIDEAHNLPDRVRDMYSAEITDSDLVDGTFDYGEHAPMTAAMRKAKEVFCKYMFAYLKDDLRKDEDGTTVGAAHGRSVPEKLFSVFAELCRTAEEELFRAFSDKTEEKEAHLRAARAYFYRLKRFTDILGIFDGKYEWFLFYRDGQIRLKLYCVDPSGHIERRLGYGRSAVLFSATLTPLSYYADLFGLGRTASVLSVESPFDPERLSVTVMDKISTRYSERERTMPAVLRAIAAAVGVRRGHYMVFTPSFAYNAALGEAFRRKYPKLRVNIQTPDMSQAEREAFIQAFSEDDPSYLVAFCVMGGVYSEGIDLCGEKLIGAVIVGVGMPGLSFEREALRAYYDEKTEEGEQYAYLYPGFNKVLQAAGRVIRREEDRGVLVLIDDRLGDPVYRKNIPKQWHHLKYAGDAKSLRMLTEKFWNGEKERGN